MAYDCITCGPLPLADYHDGRDDTHCVWDCIPNGECRHPSHPAVKGEDGRCYWAGKNGHDEAWGLPDPAHREREEPGEPVPYKPLPGQIGFDGTVVGGVGY